MAEREKVGLVTDSASMIRPEEAKILGIDVGAIGVHFDDEGFDDYTITAREVKQKFDETGIHPATAGVLQGDLIKAYKKQLGISEVVISIHIPKRFSSATYTAARTAALGVQRELELGKGTIEIFDSGNIGPAFRYLVLETVNLLHLGENLQLTLPQISALRSRLVTTGTFEDLSWVAKTQRFDPRLLEFFQRAKDFFNRAPIVQIRNGEVFGPNPFDPREWKKLPSKENAMRRIARIALADDVEKVLGIFHFDVDEKANELAFLIKRATGVRPEILEPPASFAAGAGPGFVGISTLKK